MTSRGQQMWRRPSTRSNGCSSSMSLAPSYLEATATVATVARAVGDLDALVAISQMTVSQMNALSMRESRHQRLHWL